MGGRRVVLWRHGQTASNAEGRFQGQSDVALDETGAAQAERAARMLASLAPEAIVSSDLRRAGDTAYALSTIAGVPVTFDSGLRERSMGQWEGLSQGEVQARFPAEWAARQPTDGETYGQVGDRVLAVLEREIEKTTFGGALVVVGHGASIRSGLARLLGLPEAVWPRIGPLGNCAWSILGEGHLGWRLLEHNAGTLPQPVLSDDR